MQTQQLKISGMSCGGCADAIARSLKTIPGVHEVAVSFDSRLATVRFDERSVPSERLESAVRSAGYDIAAPDAQPEPRQGRCCCG